MSFSPLPILSTLLLWACLGLPAAAAPVQAEPVVPGVWFVQGESALGSPANRNFVSNAAFVATRDGTVMIDALGSAAVAREAIALAERLTGQPVRMVIVTHYHADHIYGLRTLREHGATIVAHGAAREYLNADTARLRLQQSRIELAPWVDEHTTLEPADRWVGDDTVIEVGGERFVLRHAGPAHTPEDLIVYAERARVLFAGDLVFRGRVPFVGQADSRRWIDALDRLLAFDAQVLVPGHGPLSLQAHADLELTRDYLVYLRRTMGEAASAMEPFDEAYARTDWSRFEKLPLFGVANRINAYNTYLLMEQEGTPRP